MPPTPVTQDKAEPFPRAGRTWGGCTETEAGVPRFLSLVLPPPMALVLKEVRVEFAWDLVML